ncbi:hypothetical protein SEVIR_4G277680v4 [Setaria viridis]
MLVRLALKHLYQYSEPTSLFHTEAVQPQPRSPPLSSSKLSSTNLMTSSSLLTVTATSQIDRAVCISMHALRGCGTGHWSTRRTGSSSSTLHSRTPPHRSIHASPFPLAGTALEGLCLSTS